MRHQEATEFHFDARVVGAIAELGISGRHASGGIAAGSLHQFHLAIAVLQDDYEGALEIMRKIGPEGDVTKVEYRDWPLFRELRTRNDFLATFKDIFGEVFDQDVTVENRTVAMEDNTPIDLLRQTRPA
jgi:hypothetical protein